MTEGKLMEGSKSDSARAKAGALEAVHYLLIVVGTIIALGLLSLDFHSEGGVWPTGLGMCAGAAVFLVFAFFVVLVGNKAAVIRRDLECGKQDAVAGERRGSGDGMTATNER